MAFRALAKSDDRLKALMFCKLTTYSTMMLVVAVNGTQKVQPTPRQLVETAVAKAVVREQIAQQFKSAGYQFALRSWDEEGAWRTERPPADAQAIAKTLRISMAANDPAVIECEKPRTEKLCGIVGNTNLVAFGLPRFVGDSATLRVTFWYWSPPAARINDRFPDRPGAHIVYLLAKQKNNWKVIRVLQRTI